MLSRILFCLALLSPALIPAAKVLPVLNDDFDELRIRGDSLDFALDLDSVFGTEPIDDQAVRMTFNLLYGDQPVFIDFALFSDRTPLTRANFLQYVNSGAYVNQVFHRYLSGFVLQGGGYYLHTDPETNTSTINAIPTNAPVANEFGISNTEWTIAMAKLKEDPDSATSQWFINLGDNSENLDSQNGGFTVFARVLQSTQDDTALLTDPGFISTITFSGLQYFPLLNYDGVNLTVNNLLLFPTATLVDVDPADAGESTVLTYAVTQNSNSDRFTVTLDPDGHTLRIAQIGTGYDESTVTVTATDSVGNVIANTFTVQTTQTYQEWREAFFSASDAADDSISGPAADVDGDGLSNLELYVSDLSPAIAVNESPYLLAFVTVGETVLPRFTFRWRTDISGLSYAVQRSIDLEGWDDIPASVLDETNEDYLKTLTIQPDEVPADSDVPVFYRWIIREP